MSNFSSNLAILFPLGSCLYIAMRLSDGQTDGKGGGWARALVYTITSLLIAFSIVGILFRVGPVSLVWLFAAAFLGLLIWVKSRALNRLLLLRSFTSVSTNIARERMAADFVEHNSWFVASRAKRFRRALATGMQWPEAMEKVGLAKTTSEIFSCRCMAAYGSEVERSTPPSLDPLRIQAETERLLGRLMVIPWSTAGLVIVVLAMWYIVPTFKQIFAEFDLTLPQSMLTFINFSDILVGTPLAALLGICVSLVAFVVGCIAVVWFFPRLILLLPLRWIARPYFRALGLSALAQSVRRQADFSQACNSAATLLPVPFIGNKLQTAASHYAQGASPDRALARTGLLYNHEAEIISASVKSHSFPWALEQLAVSATERMLAFYSVAVQLLILVSVMFYAVIFGWLAIGVIEVLSLMIEQLAKV